MLDVDILHRSYSLSSKKLECVLLSLNTSRMVAPVPTEASLPESMGSFHLPTHRQWVEAAVEATVKAGLQLQHDLLLICILRSMSLPGVFANGLQCIVNTDVRPRDILRSFIMWFGLSGIFRIHHPVIVLKHVFQIIWICLSNKKTLPEEQQTLS